EFDNSHKKELTERDITGFLWPYQSDSSNSYYFKLQIPTTYRDAARLSSSLICTYEWVRRSRLQNFSEDLVYEMIPALLQALRNTIHHGSGENPESNLTIEHYFTSKGIVARVINEKANSWPWRNAIFEWEKHHLKGDSIGRKNGHIGFNLFSMLRNTKVTFGNEGKEYILTYLPQNTSKVETPQPTSK
ncbi:MAG: hypothetical protein AABY07_05910, partial [Nanoarchaeota archaeon]